MLTQGAILNIAAYLREKLKLIAEIILIIFR